MKKSVLSRRTSLIGTLVASAALGQGFMTPAHAAEVQRVKYRDAIRDVLTSFLSDRFAQSTTSSQASVQSFDIAPGPLGHVLDAFARASRLTVTMSTAGLEEIWSPGVSGRFTVEEALERLLADTGTGARFTSSSAVTIDIKGQSEYVEVVGGPPAVSLPKLTSPVRDIPQTISIVTAEVFESQGATTLRDVLRNVPGVTFQAGEGGGGLPGDTLSVRGFSAGNDIFVDGVRDVGAYSRDVFNLEQVEVIKGPSSSVMGRGSTGGAINQVTKSPTMGPSTNASVVFGNESYQRMTADLNQPLERLGEGTSFRINAMWTDANVPGRDIVENSSWGVAPSLAFGLTSPTRVILKYQRLEQENVPDYGLPWGTYPGYPTGAFEATPEIDQSNFYGLQNYDFEDIQNDLATGEVIHEFRRGLTLRNLTRYGQTDRDSAITAPRPPNRQLQRRTMGNDQIANQTTLNSRLTTGRVHHDLVTGLDFSRETTNNRNSAQSTNQPATTIENPNPTDLPLGPMPANSGNPSETRLNQAGIYLFDTVSLGSRWQVTGGLRYDVVDTHFEQTTLATGAITTADANDGMLSWRAGVVFKPQPNGSIYVSAGTSFNPSVDAGTTGAALSTNPNAANNVNLDPEETRNLEAGAKWDLQGGRLALTGAVFNTEKVNARTRSATNEPFVLEGEQRVRGVELGVSGRISEAWTALVSYAFMDSKIEESANAAEEGQNMTLTPEQTFNLWTTYQLPWRLTIGGGAQYMDAVFRNTLNTQQVPSYWVANTMAAYQVNRMLTLRLNVENVGDTEYVDRIGGGHYIPGPGRQVLLSTDLIF